MVNSAMANTGAKAVSAIWQIAPWFIFLQFAIPLVWRFYDYCLMQYEPALHNHITKIMTDHVLKQSHNYYQNNFTGNLANKIFSTPKAISSMIVTIMNSFLINFLSLAIAIYALWKIHFWFGVSIFLWASVFILFSIRVIKKFNFLARDTVEAGAKIMGNIVDSLGNVSCVRYFTGRNLELSKLDTVQNEYLKAMHNRRWFLLKFYSVQGFALAIYQGISFCLLIYLFSKNLVTPGDFAMILTINLLIVDNLWKMSTEIRGFSDNWGAVDQTLKMVDQSLEVEDLPEAYDLIVNRGEIVFDNVTFHHHDTKEKFFSNTSIIIKPQQKIGLVGSSGSGKSTFVNLILRLFDVEGGAIYIDGQNIKNVTQESLRRNIAIIPQDPSLFHRTILENIRYGNPTAKDEAVIEAAKKVAAHDFIISLPEGYETYVGERGIKLSGGQRQRIAIARAILKNAAILILDEATSQLDSVTEHSIQNSLLEVMRNKTTIVIAHRLQTLLDMDRILVFENGKIVQEGDHTSLLAEPGLYKTLWNTQTQTEVVLPKGEVVMV